MGFERVLFLDFDGVINSRRFMKARSHEPCGGDWELHDIDPEAVARLNRVIEATGAVVVVSSVWRLIHERVRLSEFLRACGFTGQVVDVTPNLFNDGQYRRGGEISAWLRTSREEREIRAYAVVDDDFDAGIGHAPRFVQTTFEEGLTDADADRLIAILGRDCGDEE